MNGFREDELVAVQGRQFPVVGGRLRLLHEGNQRVSIKTELVQYELDQMAVVRSTVTTERGDFTATGVATASRDPRLVDALLELAETRSVARALRYAGYGVEVCGVEELGNGLIPDNATGPSRHQPLRVVAGGRSSPGAGREAPRTGSSQKAQPEPTRQAGGGNSNGANGSRNLTVATAAQLRAIRTLARQVGISPEVACTDKYGHGRVEGLTVKEASGLIDDLKSQKSQPVA